MVKTISMQDMRHLNLFDKVTKLRTSSCFSYNDTLMYCVPKSKIQQALGRSNENLRRISEIVKKRVRIIALPKGEEDIESFIKSIISPVQYKELEVTENEVILTAGSQSKAALLGRNKRRLLEMQKIIADFFKKEYRVM